ncbi:Gfo/Idh/MocA family oxidoreductase [Chloroflexi bacterium TSY]|nr:Gfo/Idh/MocA family oxidoreductase [Chloroflexi bacterium TSY]
MFNVALIGCAHIHTPGFIKRLQDRNDVQVKFVWDHEADRAQKRANELGAVVTNDLDAIWADDNIPAVVICSETDRHQLLVTGAAKAGKHMFVEKPLGMAANDAYAMADAIEQAGVLFQTGYFQRGIPINQFVKEQIDKGHFGKITRIRHSNCHAGALRDIFTPEWLWMTDLKQAGVGAFGDLGTHSLDILMWLMGDVKQVTATIDPGTNRYGCDETGEALIRFTNGVIGSLAAGWLDVAHPVGMIVSGTEGHAHVNDGQLYFQSEHVEGADGQSPWIDLPEAWPHAFDLFLDATGGKANIPLVGAREAAARSHVMDAMYRAANGGNWVTI